MNAVERNEHSGWVMPVRAVRALAPCNSQSSLLPWEFRDSTSYQQRHHVAGGGNGSKRRRCETQLSLSPDSGTPLMRIIGLAF